MSSVLLVLMSRERKRYFPVVMMQSSSLATFSSVSPWREEVGEKKWGEKKGERRRGREVGEKKVRHVPAYSFPNTVYHVSIIPFLSHLTPHSSSLPPPPSPLTSARENHSRMSVILMLTVSSCFSPLVTSRLVTCDISP